jgi:hypothetical protein
MFFQYTKLTECTAPNVDPYSTWITDNFAFQAPSTASVSSYGPCAFPFTCDYSYVNFYDIINAPSNNYFYNYNIALDVSPVGSSTLDQNYHISAIPGTDQSGNPLVIQSSSACGVEAYVISLKHPPTGNFTVSITLLYECSQCNSAVRC